ncbi:HAD superfamily, subfamily IIIB (Acid phosphatase) [Nocardia amikacinitolerans]|uniref:HAD family acid phosphatase n=1 Tax=Nocardia amikacinitolerans TaxID=756689 RepID=UPI0020A39E8A|nr:HAD family acid phosphatase [Nocardia amikacinitolerans]MCP2294194.1 HAD superfamily, subfamily IIIB (Acid phosphatase) [Nocardia amikacinitolerans]
MRRSVAGIALGITITVAAPLSAAQADTGSSSLSGGSGSSSLSGGSGSSSLSGGGGLPPYSRWITEVQTVAAQARDYLAGRLPGATRPAIVLDIDNTSLETQYNPGPITPAIAPILQLATWAESQGAAIIFVTGRPALMNLYTQTNLTAVGYPVDGLYGSPLTTLSAGSSGLEQYKTNARIDIEGDGYTIVANIGNSASDLAGGHAERTFKLPDYDGKLS